MACDGYGRFSKTPFFSFSPTKCVPHFASPRAKKKKKKKKKIDIKNQEQEQEQGQEQPKQDLINLIYKRNSEVVGCFFPLLLARRAS
tara:strand:- start:184 stop:444 length:261 start_codon:yes stop_codon:yes gene_type:complete